MRTKTFTFFLILLLASTVQAGKIINRPKSRVGITFEKGYGSESISLLKLEGGGSSSISFGGGFVGTYFYGYEFSRHYDLSTSVGVHKTYQDPAVQDTEITFTSYRISITPAYIIPINDGSRMRFKLGAGLDLSCLNDLYIKIYNPPYNLDDTWSYKSSVGYHINANFEVNTSRRWAFSGGLQYNGISYNFDPSSNTYPLNSDLKSPNGSGINIVFGAYYCF